MSKNLKFYKLSPEGFNQERRKLINQGVAFSIFVIGIILFGRYLQGDKTSLIITAILVPFLAIPLAIGINNGIKIRRDKWLSYELLVGYDFILKKEANIADVEIYQDEITKLEQISNGNIIVRTKEKDRFILIPNSLVGFEEAKNILLSWQNGKPITTARSNRLSTALLFVCTMASFIIVMYVNQIRIVLPAALFLIPFYIWSLIQIQRNPQIDPKIKQGSWLFILVLISLIFRIIALLKS